MAVSENNSPLKNKRILITRPREQAQAFIDLLLSHQAEPVVFSTIHIVPPRSWEELDQALASLPEYDTVIFTSVNGVLYFFDRLKQKNIDADVLRNRTLVAIGPSTAARLEEYGFNASIVPEKFQAESVIDALEQVGIAGRRFLLPRAEEARQVLPEEIVKRGGAIDVVTAYCTEKAAGRSRELLDLLEKRQIDIITFTSSSTVKNFVALLGPQDYESLASQCVVACIGPITADTAVSYNLHPRIVAGEYTIEGLTEAMIDYFKKAGS